MDTYPYIFIGIWLILAHISGMNIQLDAAAKVPFMAIAMFFFEPPISWDMGPLWAPGTSRWNLVKSIHSFHWNCTSFYDGKATEFTSMIPIKATPRVWNLIHHLCGVDDPGWSHLQPQFIHKISHSKFYSVRWFQQLVDFPRSWKPPFSSLIYADLGNQMG